jgi:hypothetical protein
MRASKAFCAEAAITDETKKHSVVDRVFMATR